MEPVPTKHFTEKAIEWKPNSALKNCHQRDVKDVRIVPIAGGVRLVKFDGNIVGDVVPSPEICHFFRCVN
jgi:hypothetical protein